VESVTCVDMTPFQLALAQEALEFLGMNDTVTRLQVYEKILEPVYLKKWRN